MAIRVRPRERGRRYERPSCAEVRPCCRRRRAFARLPHTLISHQRRRPFFVTSRKSQPHPFSASHSRTRGRCSESRRSIAERASTIALGAVAGFLLHYEDFGLMYLDGHLDLNTPESSASGVLDSMVMAHMFGHVGTAAELRDLGRRTPLLDPADVVYFGYNDGDMNPIEAQQLPQLAATRYPLSGLEGDIHATAADALAFLEDKVARFALHFDVDVIRFDDLPIANVPSHHEGLTFDQAMDCIEVFASSSKCVGVLITEINPDHATEAEGERFASGLALALGSLPPSPPPT